MALNPRIGDVLWLFSEYDPEPLYGKFIAEHLGMFDGDAARRARKLAEYGILREVEDPDPRKGPGRNRRMFVLTEPGRLLAQQPLARSLAYELGERPVVLNRSAVAVLRHALSQHPDSVGHDELHQETGVSLVACRYISAKLRRAGLFAVDSDSRGKRSHLVLTPMGLELARQCSRPGLPLEIFPD